MSEEERSADAVDAPTRRLGTYMAILSVLQAGSVLVDGNVADSFAVASAFGFVLALALRAGRRWARSVLVALSCGGVVLLVLAAMFGAEQPADRLAAVGWALATVLDIVALAFTVPAAGVALDLPERWRPWATSLEFHLVILGTGIVGLFVPA